MRIVRKIAAVAAVCLWAGVVGGGAALASPAAAAGRGGAPSACRPANHLGRITPARVSSGHRHYRVTLTAPRGFAPCRLAGSPTGVRFSRHGSLDGVTVGRYGSQRRAVSFGPGHPVHFDIQVPNGPRGTRADEATFTLRTPGGGVIPGESSADGALVVTRGTLIGPVQAGA